MDKIKKLGIIGGLGPESTARFYLDIIKYFKIKNPNTYPSIVIDSVSFDKHLEGEIIVENKNENKMKEILINSAKKIKRSGADICVMPCNTLHIFFNDISKNMKMISIIDSVINEIKIKKLKKVLLLATTKTIESKIYSNAFLKNKINFIIPSSVDQKKISQIIIKILDNKYVKKDFELLKKIIYKFKKNGVDSIILGCTDFDIILDDLKKLDIKIIDSLDVLAKTTVEYLII